MSDRNEDRLPQELAEMGEMLRENRAQASGLELDAIKLQVKSRARRAPSGQLRRGVNVRSRGVTAILTLLLLGGTTAAGIAGGSGHDNNGGGAADAQYQPPKCTKDMRKCECPKGYSLTVSNGQIVCQRNEPAPPPDCDDHKGRGNDHCDNGHHNGHGHHHHKNWRQHHNGHWQWCDGDGRNDRDWHDWNGRDDDW